MDPGPHNKLLNNKIRDLKHDLSEVSVQLMKSQQELKFLKYAVAALAVSTFVLKCRQSWTISR